MQNLESPVELTTIDKVAQFLEKYVFIRNPKIYRLIAFWIAATYLCKEFEYMGYLFAYSPKPSSGKSRLLEVLDVLVYNSSGILVSPTGPVLFRTAADGTQLLDEVDSWTNREELRALLNAGFHRGNTIPRMKETSGDYEVERFPVFAPRAMAGIGKTILNATTLDRTFLIEMMRQKPEERRAQFRLRNVKPEAEALSAEVKQWVEAHKSVIVSCYEPHEPPVFPYLKSFRDRTIDVAEPLATILEVAYKTHPQLGEIRSDLVEALAVTRDDGESWADEHRILTKLAELAQIKNPLIGTASELAQMFDGEKPSEALSATLRQYGFKTKSVRKDGVPKYRYVLPYDELQELCTRYAPQTVQAGREGEGAAACEAEAVCSDIVAELVGEPAAATSESAGGDLSTKC
jgi:uncharacterized protein DUF3631